MSGVNIGDEAECPKHGYQFHVFELYTSKNGDDCFSSEIVQAEKNCIYQVGYIIRSSIRDYLYNIQTGYWIKVNSSTTKINDVSAQTINNHICSTCGNNRCNTSEKSCWKCGGKL